MGRYASDTEVPVDRTRAQIESLLAKHGADAFGYATEGYRAMIRFNILSQDGNSRLLGVQITLKLPDPSSPEFTKTSTGKDRERTAALKSWEQACRSSWRALHLVIKAKLEAAKIGISTLEREFMPDVLLPSGLTIGQAVESQREALASGNQLRLLPGK